jgi:hypothetical protein
MWRHQIWHQQDSNKSYEAVVGYEIDCLWILPISQRRQCSDWTAQGNPVPHILVVNGKNCACAILQTETSRGLFFNFAGIFDWEYM